MYEMWFVYIIETEKKRLYTGIAKDPEKRFFEHLFDRKKGAKFFRSDVPERIVYVKKCSSLSNALKEEIAIKKCSKIQKLQLIEEFIHKNRL